MTVVRIFTEAELRDAVPLDADAVATVEEAFVALAGGGVVMPPILRLDIPAYNGEVDVKTAYVPGLDSFALKVSPGFFDNPKLGLPSVNGMMVLLSARTGLLEALLLDNGYLTDIRTAAAGAVAARHLARADARTAAVLGAGVQARLQIAALTLVRDIRRVLVWARDPAEAAAYAASVGAALGLAVEVADSAETAVRQADIAVTTTPARSPILKADWLHPGLHVTAMGSDAEEKNELEPAVLARADRFVCDRRSQSIRLGELHHAVAAGAMPEDAPVVELGEIAAGTAPGRSAADEVTVCDLTGTGVQDTAIALHAVRAAAGRGCGTAFET
jgi:ornithine cyclodeaminase